MPPTMSRRTFLEYGAAGAVAGLAGCAELGRGASEEKSGWPMFQYDAANTGHRPSGSGPTGAVETRWEALPDATVGGSPAVSGGTVFVGGDQRFYAVDAVTGDVDWRFELDGMVSSTPAVRRDVVYVPGDERLYAVDTEGNEQWTHALGSRVTTDPIVVGNIVYVASRGGLYALTTSGKFLWRFRQEFDNRPAAQSLTGPALGGPEGERRMYVGGNHEFEKRPEYRFGRLYALDAADGTEQWRVEVEENVSTPTVADGRVYFGTRHGKLVALDAATGDEVWRFDVGGDIASSPAVADGTLYFGADSIYALDAATGEPRWTVELPEETRWSNSSPAVVDGVVYVCSGVASREGRIYALDTSDGEQVWQVKRDRPVFTDPAVVDGSVYVTAGGLQRLADPE